MNQVRIKVNPPGICHTPPHWHATPHWCANPWYTTPPLMCHPFLSIVHGDGGSIPFDGHILTKKVGVTRGWLRYILPCASQCSLKNSWKKKNPTFSPQGTTFAGKVNALKLYSFPYLEKLAPIFPPAVYASEFLLPFKNSLMHLSSHPSNFFPASFSLDSRNPKGVKLLHFTFETVLAAQDDGDWTLFTMTNKAAVNGVNRRGPTVQAPNWNWPEKSFSAAPKIVWNFSARSVRKDVSKEMSVSRTQTACDHATSFPYGKDFAIPNIKCHLPHFPVSQASNFTSWISDTLQTAQIQFSTPQIGRDGHSSWK